MGVKAVRRFDIWLVRLDPTLGHEIKKTRPCVVISPDEMVALSTVLAAPLTTRGFGFPTRISCCFQGKSGFVVLDQIRALDKVRLIRKMGTLEPDVQRNVCACLQEMFAW